MSHILVVEDSRLSRRMVVDALREVGHVVRESENGEEALESFHQERPSCVVTDLLMPVMGGQELLRRIRAIDTDVPIIVASADIQHSSRSECEELGINAFLQKPLQMETFLACIESALAQAAGVELNDAN